MSRNELVDLELDIKHETDKAILVHDGVREAWLPLSQVEIERIGKRGSNAAIVTMPTWLAVEKRLI